jgi:hypothetical protein
VIFAPSLRDKEKDEIKGTAKTIVERIDKLPEALQKNRNVTDCLKAMQKIVQS